MDVGREGKALAATLNHSALNIANALGAWLGGLVIAAGYGYTAPAVVGALLSVVGLAVLAVSVAVGGTDAAVGHRCGGRTPCSGRPMPTRPHTTEVPVTA